MRTNKKILIIGAKGMLGTDLMREFEADSNYLVTGTDISDFDITNENQVRDFIKKNKPDYVINAAAYTDVDKCEEDKDICNKVNGQALQYIAKACRDENAILVHISTDYVFDGLKAEGYKEGDKINPVNQYGASKAFGEKMVRENMEKYYIVRISWLFGKNGKNFVETMLNLAKDHKELKVVNDQHGKPTYTVDLAKALKDLIETKPVYGVYHSPNEEQTTWYDFAVEIFKNAGQDINVNPCTSEEFPRPAKRPQYSILINSRLPKLRSWREALKEYLSK